MKPSLFKQISAVAVDGTPLMESPRHWNSGLIRYRDRLWMSYRYHQREHEGRCATAMVELDPVTFQAKGKSQMLKFRGTTGTEHHEDARLFMFDGAVHISYTEMRGYRPGVDYTCVMKYARLKLGGSRWEVVKEWHPKYGLNDGRSKEKNWVFFEHERQLFAIYSGFPKHVVIQLDGDKIVREYATDGPTWHFGAVRGGSTPVRQADGTLLTIFHSSVRTEAPPHFVRYYAAAYTLEGKPPFAPIRISTRPLMIGSEADGHKVDPRYVEGWKPFVVFPCGLVPDGADWLVSLGLNDWQCVIARLKADALFLGAANGSDVPPRFFTTSNGSMPVKVVDDHGHVKFLHWIVSRGRPGQPSVGVMRCVNPMEAQVVAEIGGVEETDFETYERTMGAAGRMAV